MRWTRQRFARDGIAGRVERLVSDQQRADERCCSVRRSRVVLTPRRWRQVCGVASAQPGLDKTYSADDGGKRARSPGRARRKPLKPLRAGMPGDSGVLVVTRVRSTTTSAHEAAGATGIRRSPRPLWAEDSSTARAHGAARANVCLDVIASEAKQSMVATKRKNGLLRSARNDGSPRRRGACHQVRVRATRWLAMTATAIDRFAERDEIERRRYGTLMRSQPARS